MDGVFVSILSQMKRNFKYFRLKKNHGAFVNFNSISAKTSDLLFLSLFKKNTSQK